VDKLNAGERNGVLPGRTGKQFTRGQIGGNAEKYGTAGALFEAKERIGEGASPETIRGTLTSHPEVTVPKGQNAERLRMFQTAGNRDRTAERESQEDSGQKLFFPGGREEMLEYLREHPDAALPNGIFEEKYLGNQFYMEPQGDDNGLIYKIKEGDKKQVDFTGKSSPETNRIDVIEEHNRDEGKKLLEALNHSSGVDFQPLINVVDQFDEVDCEIQEPYEIDLERKQREVIRDNPARKTVDEISDVYSGVTTVLDIAGLIKDAATMGADNAFIKDQMGGGIEGMVGSLIDQAVAATDKTLSGYDTDGHKIDKIYRQTIEVAAKNSKSSSTGEHHQVTYDYHIVDGMARILSVTVDGEPAADYYKYKEN